MNKIFCLLSLCLINFYFGQSYTLEQAEKTSDVKVIAGFIKDNPTHTKVPELKRKMASIMGGNPSSASSTASNYTPSQSKTMANNTGYGKAFTPEDGKVDKYKTASLLTHMFNNDPNKKEVYISIVNQSKCDMEVLFKGKSTHNIKVPAMKTNFILIDKGNYTLSSSVCGAPYNANKSLYQDTEIKLKN